MQLASLGIQLYHSKIRLKRSRSDLREGLCLDSKFVCVFRIKVMKISNAFHWTVTSSDGSTWLIKQNAMRFWRDSDSPEKKALSDLPHRTTQLLHTMEICILINCLYSYSKAFGGGALKMQTPQLDSAPIGFQRVNTELSPVNCLKVSDWKWCAEEGSERTHSCATKVTELANWFRIIEFHFSSYLATTSTLGL